MCIEKHEVCIDIGIDPATYHTGLVILGATGNEPMVSELITAPASMDGLERCHLMSNEIARILGEAVWDKGTACVERPFCLNKSAFGLQMKVIGFMERVLVELGVDLVEPDNQTIKSFIGGEQRNKGGINRQTTRKYGFESPEHDIMDAYAMAQFARAVRNRDSEITPVRERVIIAEFLRTSRGRAYFR